MARMLSQAIITTDESKMRVFVVIAPGWPQVNNGSEHTNEYATYLREACNQLRAADRGRTSQIPWHVVQAYIEFPLALIGKVLQQPSVGEVLHHIQGVAKDIQGVAKDIQNIQRDEIRTRLTQYLQISPGNKTGWINTFDYCY
ncbi:hypothetical protein RBB50_012761 [Rhinocladiella similis]